MCLKGLFVFFEQSTKYCVFCINLCHRVFLDVILVTWKVTLLFIILNRILVTNHFSIF